MFWALIIPWPPPPIFFFGRQYADVIEMAQNKANDGPRRSKKQKADNKTPKFPGYPADHISPESFFGNNKPSPRKVQHACIMPFLEIFDGIPVKLKGFFVRQITCLLFMLVLTALFVTWPEADIFVSSLFYEKDVGFFWKGAWILNALEQIAYYGSRILAGALAIAVIIALSKKRAVLRLDARAWGFLLLALLIGPGLVANVIFKDHWGRARPREIVEFGGTSSFSPAYAISDQCSSNCSFISGDGSFGFFLTSFAYVVAPKRRKKVFWGCILAGCAFGGARIAMGAHFISDVIGAAFFMLITSALLHALMYGWRRTKDCWDEFLGLISYK